MRTLELITGILVIVGALNWGLIGLADFNLVSAIFGEMTFLTRLIYILVGLSGVVLLVTVGVDYSHAHRPHERPALAIQESP